MPIKPRSEVKEKLRDLILSGHRDHALRLLQDKYGITTTEAEMLVAHALRESLDPATVIRIVLKRAVGYRRGFFRILAFSLGFIGIPVLLTGIGVMLYTNFQIQHSDRITGYVSAMEPYTAFDSPTEYIPRIVYQAGGMEHTVKAAVFSATPEFSIGDQVPLYVSREDPESVIIDTFSQRWLMPLVITGFGLLFAAGMFIILYFSKRIYSSS